MISKFFRDIDINVNKVCTKTKSNAILIMQRKNIYKRNENIINMEKNVTSHALKGLRKFTPAHRRDL
jgi:hypothetical protein